MDELTLQAIARELAATLTGGVWGRVWQVSRAALICEVRADETRLLYLCADPAAPRLYAVARRVRELERQALPPQGFAMSLRRQLEGAQVVSLIPDATDRIVRVALQGRDEMGDVYRRTLVIQLTGRAANLLLLDEAGYVRDTLRVLQGAGQEIGTQYAPPASPQVSAAPKPPAFTQGRFPTLSAAADHYYSQQAEERAFASRVAAARQKINKEIAQRARLVKRLQQDLAAQGDADTHKHKGDLLLANLATAHREGSQVTVTDYFAEDAPLITFTVDEQLTLTEAATRFFTRYAKAKRGAAAIAQRLGQLESELAELHARQEALEATVAAKDDTALDAFDEPSAAATPAKTVSDKVKDKAVIPYARRYWSSDGYEILVGRAARDNDYLTFRIARPHDWWLHAADYPGSHVVIRNPARGEVPPRTLIEAAQLAAQYSQAKNEGKADVRYTQRKFLSKPKGAAPGLVRLSTHKSMTVTPAEAGTRAKEGK